MLGLTVITRPPAERSAIGLASLEKLVVTTFLIVVTVLIGLAVGAFFLVLGWSKRNFIFTQVEAGSARAVGRMRKIVGVLTEDGLVGGFSFVGIPFVDCVVPVPGWARHRRADGTQDEYAISLREETLNIQSREVPLKGEPQGARIWFGLTRKLAITDEDGALIGGKEGLVNFVRSVLYGKKDAWEQCQNALDDLARRVAAGHEVETLLETKEIESSSLDRKFVEEMKGRMRKMGFVVTSLAIEDVNVPDEIHEAVRARKQAARHAAAVDDEAAVIRKKAGAQVEGVVAALKAAGVSPDEIARTVRTLQAGAGVHITDVNMGSGTGVEALLRSAGLAPGMIADVVRQLPAAPPPAKE